MLITRIPVFYLTEHQCGDVHHQGTILWNRLVNAGHYKTDWMNVKHGNNYSFFSAYLGKVRIIPEYYDIFMQCPRIASIFPTR
jgi:hypothetical protein